VRVGLQRPQDMKAYLQHSQSEQRRIHDALCTGDPSAARRRNRNPRATLADRAR
jgi:hypothetical protein